jgi:hypothetical protein
VREPGRTFAVVVAHPDDDAFGWAGTVAMHADDADFRFVLVHATDGGAGDIREGFAATRETLGAIRRAECATAWRAVGRMPDRHEWLGHADGSVGDVPPDELADRIGAVLSDEEPDVVATFARTGSGPIPTTSRWVRPRTPPLRDSRRRTEEGFGACSTTCCRSRCSTAGSGSDWPWTSRSSTRSVPITAGACPTSRSA